MMPDGYGDGWGMHNGSGAAWLVLAVLLILLATLAVALVVVLLRSPVRDTGRGSPAAAGSEAERILRRRFAAGEIDEEEFRHREAALTDHTG